MKSEAAEGLLIPKEAPGGARARCIPQRRLTQMVVLVSFAIVIHPSAACRVNAVRHGHRSARDTECVFNSIDIHLVPDRSRCFLVSFEARRIAVRW